MILSINMSSVLYYTPKNQHPIPCDRPFFTIIFSQCRVLLLMHHLMLAPDLLFVPAITCYG